MGMKNNNKQLSADTEAQEKLREFRKDVIAEPKAQLDPGH